MNRYQIKKLKDCSENDKISVDPNYTMTSVSALLVADHQNFIKIKDVCCFAYREFYPFAPQEAVAIVDTMNNL